MGGNNGVIEIFYLISRSPKTNVKIHGYGNIFNFTLKNLPIYYLHLCASSSDNYFGPGMLSIGNSTNKLYVVIGAVFFDEG